MSLERWRWLSIISGMIGTILFAAVLIAIQTQRALVEERLQRVVIVEVENQVRLALEPDETGGSAKQMLGKLAAKYDAEAAIIQKNLADNVPAIVAGLLGGRCKADCETRAKLSSTIASVMTNQAAKLKVGEETLGEFVVDRYDRTTQNLIADVSIFSFTNLVAFASLLLLATFKGRAARHLAPLLVMLIISVGLASYMYLFGQDWLATILFNDFTGWGYAVWIGMIYALLFDIVFLRGFVISMIGGALGAALSAC